MRYKRYIAAFSAVLCLCTAVSCGKEEDSSLTSGSTKPFASEESVTGQSNTDASDVKSTSSGKLGEKVTPEEGDEEYDLGEYYVSEGGVKLYFDTEEFSDELALFMADYFDAYMNKDYEKYRNCNYPSYVDEIGKFLQKDYSYGLETSFSNHCDQLREKMGGDYTITRIKLEAYDGDVTKFFEYPSACFGKDYYAEIKDEVDNFYDMLFFVMAKGSDGKEELLVSENEIVIAEKDGRLYTFG